MLCANDVIYGRVRPQGYMGESSFDQNKGLIQLGLSQIPVVGPILSTLTNFIDPLFGWGDPNSQHDLSLAIVNGREQLAMLRKHVGIADPFFLPPGFDQSDDHDVANLSMIIVNEYLKKLPMDLGDVIENDFVHDTGSPSGFVQQVWHAYPSTEERKDKYSVISKIKSDLSSLQSQLTAAALAPGSSSMPAPLPPSSVPPPPIAPDASQSAAPPAPTDPSQIAPAPPPQAPNQVSSLETMGPWILGGGAAMIGVFALIAATSPRN